MSADNRYGARSLGPTEASGYFLDLVLPNVQRETDFCSELNSRRLWGSIKSKRWGGRSVR